MEHRLAAKALAIINPAGHRMGDLSGSVNKSSCGAEVFDAASSAYVN